MHTQKIIKPFGLLGIIVLGITAGGLFLQQKSTRHATDTRSPRLGETTATVASIPAKSETFADFSEWLDTFDRAEISTRPALAAEGLRLARERRIAMEALIQSDPREALNHAVTLDVWKSLPPELRSEVEEPFSAIADFRVLPVCITGSPDADRIAAGEKFPDATRWTEIEGSPALQSHVFGRRKGLSTKEKSPVQGIRLGNRAALREGVFHPLTPAESTVAESLYPLANPSPDSDFSTGSPLGTEPVTALAGGKIFKFSDTATFETFAAAIATLDENPGPHSGAAVLFLPKSADGGAGFDLAGATAFSNRQASAWTETKKKVFMIRCDFSDKPDSTNPVVNAATYGALLNTTISDSIRDFSYGKTWIEATVSASVTRLPQPATYYDDNTGDGSTRNDALLNDAKAAYQAANPSFVPSSYDIVGVWFVSIGMKGSGVTYAGLAGGSQLWIQGTSDVGVHVHEFGHNYGLGHSSFWTPPAGSTNPVDPAGAYEEYGDVFDVMGDGPVPEGVFHSEAKQRLNWLSNGQWTDATASGSATHRLYRIDHPNTTGMRGLRVTKGGGDYYWLNYRRLFSNSWLKAGANIVWQPTGEGRSWLIDTTPGSIPGSPDRTDGSLAIGRTYSDGNSHITPLARGGASPNEYLDIRVNTGPFPGNAAPTATLQGPSTVAARQTCIFTAQAVDGNGDALAYSWDFGQGFTFDNNPTATFAWNSGGTYTVKVTVSDMKGNSVQATKTVTVSDAITTWTTRPNTSTGDFKTLVASPGRVVAMGTDYGSFRGPIATSQDGVTWTSSQLQDYGQIYAAAWDGSKFIACGEDYTFEGSGGWLGAVYTSPSADAGTWTRRVYTGSTLRGVAYGNGIHVAVGDNGTIRRSTDGISWTPVTSGTTYGLTSISYGGGKFVIIGSANPYQSGNAMVLTSSDGSSWTNTTTGAGIQSWEGLRYVKWTGDRFLASGWFGKIRHSTDLGTTFTTTRSTIEETPGLAYGNGVWFAAGIDRDNSGADIDLISPDGANWTTLTTPSLDDRAAAIFFNNTFITAGANHSIRQSGTISANAAGYYTWRESNFPDHGPLSMPQSDNDGDSIPNLLEYSLNRSPLTGSGSDGPAALPQALLVSSEPLLNDRLALQISMPAPAALDLTYVVEASPTLTGSWTPLATKVANGSWTWNPGGTSRIISGASSGGRILVKIGDSVPIAGNPKRFLRLRTYVNP
ncbi:MAG: PKD domain-containing protein [Verrucomicrobiota bacterium]